MSSTALVLEPSWSVFEQSEVAGVSRFHLQKAWGFLPKYLLVRNEIARLSGKKEIQRGQYRHNGKYIISNSNRIECRKSLTPSFAIYYPTIDLSWKWSRVTRVEQRFEEEIPVDSMYGEE